MAMNKVFLAMGAAVMVVAPVVAARTTSTPTQNSVVLRNGQVLPLSAQSKFVAGDRVFTRSLGTTISANGCSIEVPANSTYSVPASGCGAAVGFAQNEGGDAAGAGAGGGAGVGATTVVIGLVALAAVVAGVVATTSGSDDPNSP